MDKLIQTKNFVKREFRLSENKIFYNYSKFGNSNEVDIPFENIEGEKVTHKTSNNTILFFSVVIYVVSLALLIEQMGYDSIKSYSWLFWALIATVILAFYFITKEKFWKIKLSDSNYLYIHKNIPNNDYPEKFIDSLMNKRNQYLKENYLVIDENLDYKSQLSSVKWLRSIGAISKIEFDEKYTELKRIVKPEKTDIGFGK